MKKRLLAFLFTFLILLSVFPLSIFAIDAPEEINLDNTTIEYDFENIFFNSFKVADYQPNPNYSQIKLITMTERLNSDGNYDIYFYLYNPSQKSIYEKGTNRITLSFEDSSALFDNYSKYEIECIDTMFFTKSIKAETNGSLLKFKLKDSFDTTSLQRVYGISEIELQHKSNLKSYKIGSKFIFTEQDDGSCDVISESNEVYEIDKIGTTFYKVQTSNVNITDDIRTVYFAVDKNLVIKNGMMNSVKANWNELKLKPILLLDNKEVVSDFQSILGKDDLSDFKYSLGAGIRPGWVMNPILSSGHYGTDFEYGFNVFKFPSRFYAGVDVFHGNLVENTLWAEHFHNTFFDLDDAFNPNVFDKILDKLYFVQYCEMGDYLSAEDVLINADRWDGSLDGIYSSEIVSSDKYNDVTFNIVETETIGKYEVNTNYFDYLFNSFNFSTNHSTDITFNKFEIFNFKDLELDNAELSKKWLIDLNDIDKFRAFAKNNKDSYIYFLRYAITESKQLEASVFSDSTVKSLFGEVNCYECNGSLVETVLIDNFDVIELKFKDSQGNYKTIPTAMTPEDSAVNVTHEKRILPSGNDFMTTLTTLLIITISIVVLVIVLMIVFSIIKNKKRGRRK